MKLNNHNQAVWLFPALPMSLLIILIIIIWGLKPFNGSKIKSALEPSDPPSQSLSRFPRHEVTSRITTPPLDDEMLVHHPGGSSHFPDNWSYPFVLLGGEWSVLPKNTALWPSQVSDMTTQLGVQSTDQSSGRIFIWEWKVLLVWKCSSWTTYYGWQLN